MKTPSLRPPQHPGRGFTLAEALVATSIFLGLLGAALAMWMLATRSSRVTTVAEALQAALLIEERLALDLHRMAVPTGQCVRTWPDRPGRVAFYVFDETGSSESAAVRGVVYALAGPGEFLQRTSEGLSRSVGTMPLTTLAFTPLLSPTGPLLRVTLEVARPATEGPGAPIIHSFLARLPSLRPAATLRWKFLSDFPSKEDAPLDPAVSGP